MLIAEEKVQSTFDDLVTRQIILHGPESVINLNDEGFGFEFRICPALASKPLTAEATKDAAFDQLPKFGPGSDLVDADPGLVVTKVCDTHLLVLNRFCVFRPQYLVLTTDSFKRQTENLDETDLAAARLVLNGLRNEHFIMFNCGGEAGCSRQHKHMQVIPCSEGFTLFPDQEGLNPKDIPFKHYIRRLDQEKDYSTDGKSSSLLEMYENLCKEARVAWQASGAAPTTYFPHNMMLTKRWMMVVPRRRAATQGASANAAGMMGMVWVTNAEQMARWKKYGPVKVLAELGVAS